jgi:hypothetical protein
MGFVKLVKENIINRFEGLLELVPKLGEAIGLLFKGKFSEAGKVATNAVAKVALGVEDIVDKTQQAIDKTKEFIEETAKEAKQAGNIADRRAKAEIIQRKLLVDRAKANREIAKLREQAEDREKFSAEERIEFIKKAAKLDDEITAKEIARVKLLRDAKKEENALGKSTTEDKLALAQLEAELIGLETQRFSKKRALTARQTALTRESIAEENRLAQEKINLQKQIAEAEANTIDEKRELQLQKEQEKYDALIEQAEANNLNTDELELSRNERLLEMRQQFADEDDAIKAKSVEEQAKLDKKKLDDQIASIQAEEENRQTQIGQVGSAIGNMQKIFSAFGKESKALAIAGIVTEQVSAISKIISNTAVANAKAVAATPLTAGMPFVAINNVTAGLSIAGSVAGAVKAISDLKGNKKSASGGKAPSVGGGGGGSANVSTPPAFNIVGASGTDQLADAIGGQSQQPVQAYVVSNDVSTAQSMDRNIVENASL